MGYACHYPIQLRVRDTKRKLLAFHRSQNLGKGSAIAHRKGQTLLNTAACGRLRGFTGDRSPNKQESFFPNPHSHLVREKLWEARPELLYSS